MKFRKKPVVIDAEQWFEVTYDREAGHRTTPIYHLDVGYYRNPDVDTQSACPHCGVIMHNHGWIDDYKDGHTVCPNDWIITGVQGEKYPCKPDIFEQTYEAA